MSDDLSGRCIDVMAQAVEEAVEGLRARFNPVARDHSAADKAWRDRRPELAGAFSSMTLMLRESFSELLPGELVRDAEAAIATAEESIRHLLNTPGPDITTTGWCTLDDGSTVAHHLLANHRQGLTHIARAAERARQVIEDIRRFVAWQRPPAQEPGSVARERKRGRTRKGEIPNDAKVLGALKLHHGYQDDGSVTNPSPATRLDLKQYKLGRSELHRFLARKFGKDDPTEKYKAACRRGAIGRHLAEWSGEGVSRLLQLDDRD